MGNCCPQRKHGMAIQRSELTLHGMWRPLLACAGVFLLLCALTCKTPAQFGLALKLVYYAFNVVETVLTLLAS
jgi:hypothetical protein